MGSQSISPEAHLPTWKKFFWNLSLFFLLPVSAYLVFDATGITKWILDCFPVNEAVLWDSVTPHVNRFVFLVFHAGVSHVVGCAAFHFLFNAGADLWCLMKHHHRSNHGQC